MNLDKITYLYKNAYLKLPPSTKKFIGSIYGSVPLNIRFGKSYGEHQKIIKEFESFSKEQQQEFMYHKTIETINYAVENIPYYTELFNQHGIEVKDIKDLSDMKKIPYLTKEIIREELQKLYTDKDFTPVEQLTGGSTFSPTKFYLPLETSRGKEKAYINNIFGKLGYKNRDKMIQFRDRRIEYNNQYWEYEPVDNHLVISATHLDKEYITKIVEQINLFAPKFFYGYPSSIARFVKLCHRMNLVINKQIKGVFLISENALPSDIESIKRFFGCQVLAHYGHSERCSTAYSIDGHAYQFQNSYGLTRIVKNEIITTSFDNFVMPFINYQLNDFVGGEIEYYDNTDCVIEVERIEGRLQEFLVDNHGNLIAATQLPYGSYEKYASIDGIQFYQEDVGKVVLHIQTEHPDEVSGNDILDEFSTFFGDSFDVSLEYVKELEKTPRGKSMIVIQKLDTKRYLK